MSEMGGNLTGTPDSDVPMKMTNVFGEEVKTKENIKEETRQGMGDAANMASSVINDEPSDIGKDAVPAFETTEDMSQIEAFYPQMDGESDTDYKKRIEHIYEATAISEQKYNREQEKKAAEKAAAEAAEKAAAEEEYKNSPDGKLEEYMRSKIKTPENPDNPYTEEDIQKIVEKHKKSREDEARNREDEEKYNEWLENNQPAEERLAEIEESERDAKDNNIAEDERGTEDDKNTRSWEVNWSPDDWKDSTVAEVVRNRLTEVENKQEAARVLFESGQISEEEFKERTEYYDKAKNANRDQFKSKIKELNGAQDEKLTDDDMDGLLRVLQAEARVNSKNNKQDGKKDNVDIDGEGMVERAKAAREATEDARDKAAEAADAYLDWNDKYDEIGKDLAEPEDKSSVDQESVKAELAKAQKGLADGVKEVIKDKPVKLGFFQRFKKRLGQALAVVLAGIGLTGAAVYFNDYDSRAAATEAQANVAREAIGGAVADEVKAAERNNAPTMNERVSAAVDAAESDVLESDGFQDYMANLGNYEITIDDGRGITMDGETFSVRRVEHKGGYNAENDTYRDSDKLHNVFKENGEIQYSTEVGGPMYTGEWKGVKSAKEVADTLLTDAIPNNSRTALTLAYIGGMRSDVNSYRAINSEAARLSTNAEDYDNTVNDVSAFMLQAMENSEMVVREIGPDTPYGSDYERALPDGTMTRYFDSDGGAPIVNEDGSIRNRHMIDFRSNITGEYFFNSEEGIVRISELTGIPPESIKWAGMIPECEQIGVIYVDENGDAYYVEQELDEKQDDSSISIDKDNNDDDDKEEEKPKPEPEPEPKPKPEPEPELEGKGDRTGAENSDKEKETEQEAGLEDAEATKENDASKNNPGDQVTDGATEDYDPNAKPETGRVIEVVEPENLSNSESTDGTEILSDEELAKEYKDRQ